MWREVGVGICLRRPTREKGNVAGTAFGGTSRQCVCFGKAEYDQAKDAYGRMEKLYKSNSLPEAKYIEVQSKWKQAEAQLESAPQGCGGLQTFMLPLRGLWTRNDRRSG